MRYICDNNRQTSGRVSRLFNAVAFREDSADRKNARRKREIGRAGFTPRQSRLQTQVQFFFFLSFSSSIVVVLAISSLFFTLDGRIPVLSRRYLFFSRPEATANYQDVSLVRIGDFRFTAAGCDNTLPFTF